MNIYDIINRAESLRKETSIGAISPERAGSIMSDTLKYLNDFQLSSANLGLDKVYASVAAMNADESPVSDLTGKPMKAGQLAVIVPADDTAPDAGKVYRFDDPGWTFVTKLGNSIYPSENIDCGRADSVYGGAKYIDCGGASEE